MSSSTAELFQAIAAQVGDILDYCIRENNPDTGDRFAGMIQNAKTYFEPSISALPEHRQANFFDEAVARTVLQKAADFGKPGSNDQAVLVRLTLAMLYGPEMRKPSGLINLRALLDQAAAKLTAIRTRVVEWIAEDAQSSSDEDEGVLERDLADLGYFANVGCFLAGLYEELQKSSSYQLAEDLMAAGLFGMRLIADTIRVDKANIILPSLREILFLVAFAWLADSDGFFFQQLLGRGDLQEIGYWHERLSDFFHTWEWEDLDYRNKISREIGHFATALSVGSE